MKKLIALTLLLVLFLSAVRPYFPYLDYAINKEYIAKVLCENIEKPKLKCNGKCHLKKELKKVMEADESDQETRLKASDQDHFYLYCWTDLTSLSFKTINNSEILIEAYQYQLRSFCKPPTPPPRSLFIS